jgi:hypothetical protein
MSRDCYLTRNEPMSDDANVRDEIGQTFAECADELNDFIATLQRYPSTVLAFALRVHLCELLRALQLQGHWSTAEVTAFLEDMAGEVNEAAGAGNR